MHDVVLPTAELRSTDMVIDSDLLRVDSQAGLRREPHNELADFEGPKDIEMDVPQ